MTSWLSVWTRAVAIPASRRAGGVWAGAAVIAAVVFGPTGMQPHDLTSMAWHEPGVAIVLGATWVLVFLPTARLLVRGEDARYLRALPSPRVTPWLARACALVVLQLPWLALWVLGDGARGIAIVAGSTVTVALLARWQARAPRARTPRWSSSLAALRAIHLRALRRRASDAIVRGLGLSILAGLVAGLFVRNNQLVGAHAAEVGTSVIAIALVPAQVGPLLALLEAHRQSAWLASSLGISRAVRVLALVGAVSAIYLVAALLAVAGAFAIARGALDELAWFAATATLVALGTSLCAARVLLAGEAKPTIATRTVVGAIAVASLAVLLLGTIGTPWGALALVAIGAASVMVVRP